MCFEASFTYDICGHTVVLSRHCEKGTCSYRRKYLYLPIGFCEKCFARIDTYIQSDPQKCLPLRPKLLAECKQFWDDPYAVGGRLSQLVPFRNKCNESELQVESDPETAYEPDDIKLSLDLPNVKSDIEHRAGISQQGYLYRSFHGREKNFKDYEATIMIHKAAIAGQICHSEVDD